MLFYMNINIKQIINGLKWISRGKQRYAVFDLICTNKNKPLIPSKIREYLKNSGNTISFNNVSNILREIFYKAQKRISELKLRYT